MRLVDADALIKETTEVRCVNCDKRKGMKNGKMTFVYEIGDVPRRACDVMDMIDALEEAPTVGGWISVKDRLPEATRPDVYGNITFSDYVLVYLVGDSMPFVTQDTCRVDHGTWMHEVPGMGWKVTHWMPLPEPPQEVSGDG